MMRDEMTTLRATLDGWSRDSTGKGSRVDGDIPSRTVNAREVGETE
jgi:hypothetical protein